MRYIGHSVVYYQGSIGYKVFEDDNGSFYSLYFDLDAFPSCRILCGKHNCFSVTAFERLCDDLPQSFNVPVFLDELFDDLAKFGVKVDLLI